MAAGAYNGNAKGIIQTLVVLEQTRGAEKRPKSRAHTDRLKRPPKGRPEVVR